MENTIKNLIESSKGILAADESTNTIEKRLNTINLPSTEENRREYRELLFSTPEIEKYISGAILFEETLMQKTTDKVNFTDYLLERGITPGIKVDKGLVEEDGEKRTQGLGDLRQRLQEYKKWNPRFAKWRAVYEISQNTPTEKAMKKNADDLADYAKICQEEGIVPIVEPEVLMDGEHTIQKCYEVTENVLNKVFASLKEKGVNLKTIILKPNMVISGKTAKHKAGVEEVAEETLKALHTCVPQVVPSINFLSGGQAPEQATAHLNEMVAKDPHAPWSLSFSYGRALQEPALAAWEGRDENIEIAQNAFLKRAKLNSLATMGKYKKELEE